MTWWLSASGDELAAARKCRGCGCDNADIDLGLCFECFTAQRKQDDTERWRELERQESEYHYRCYCEHIGFDPIAMGM